MQTLLGLLFLWWTLWMANSCSSIQPSDQGLPPKRPSSLFGGKNPSLFLFALVRSSLTHHLRSFVGRRADSCLIGVRIPVAWLRGSHVNNACACLIQYVSGLFSIPTVFSSPYIKYGQIIIHKYSKSLTNRSSSCELSEMWTCMPAPYTSCYATVLHFSRYCDVRVKMLYLLFVFLYMYHLCENYYKPVVVQYCRADCWT